MSVFTPIVGNEVALVLHAIRTDLALYRFERQVIAWLRDVQAKNGFDPAQPRNDEGRWTRIGSGYAREAQARGGGRIGGGRALPDLPGMNGPVATQAEVLQNVVLLRALAAVRQLDPRWEPRPFVASTGQGYADGLQGQIAEANARYQELLRPQIGQSFRVGDEPVRSTSGILTNEREEPIGIRFQGAKPHVRTVSPSEFAAIRSELMNGATCIPSPPRYGGTMFRRADGVEFGLRISSENGPTIDVVRSLGLLPLENIKVHQR